MTDRVQAGSSKAVLRAAALFGLAVSAPAGAMGQAHLPPVTRLGYESDAGSIWQHLSLRWSLWYPGIPEARDPGLPVAVRYDRSAARWNVHVEGERHSSVSGRETGGSIGLGWTRSPLSPFRFWTWSVQGEAGYLAASEDSPLGDRFTAQLGVVGVGRMPIPGFTAHVFGGPSVVVTSEAASATTQTDGATLGLGLTTGFLLMHVQTGLGLHAAAGCRQCFHASAGRDSRSRWAATIGVQYSWLSFPRHREDD